MLNLSPRQTQALVLTAVAVGVLCWWTSSSKNVEQFELPHKVEGYVFPVNITARRNFYKGSLTPYTRASGVVAPDTSNFEISYLALIAKLKDASKSLVTTDGEGLGDVIKDIQETLDAWVSAEADLRKLPSRSIAVMSTIPFALGLLPKDNAHFDMAKFDRSVVWLKSQCTNLASVTNEYDAGFTLACVLVSVLGHEFGLLQLGLERLRETLMLFEPHVLQTIVYNDDWNSFVNYSNIFETIVLCIYIMAQNGWAFLTAEDSQRINTFANVLLAAHRRPIIHSHLSSLDATITANEYFAWTYLFNKFSNRQVIHDEHQGTFDTMLQLVQRSTPEQGGGLFGSTALYFVEEEEDNSISLTTINTQPESGDSLPPPPANSILMQGNDTEL